VFLDSSFADDIVETDAIQRFKRINTEDAFSV